MDYFPETIKSTTTTMTDSSVSTRIASELLSVHESSIKRWCNSGELDYWTTPGGHRRIPIGKLVSFASGRGLDVSLLVFGDFAERLWIGSEAARREGNFHILSKLALEWIHLGRSDLLEAMLPFLVDRGIPMGTVFDEILGSAMGRIGSLYSSNKLSIGDEHRMTAHVRDALLGVKKSLDIRKGETTPKEQPTAIVGCIRGEVHEIGALMIRVLLIQAGWRIVYLGLDVPTEEFHAQARKHSADLVCISMAPPRGEAEALDAVELLKRLFTTGMMLRLAIGGAFLPDRSRIEPGGDITEIRLFSKTASFEEWLSDS